MSEAVSGRGKRRLIVGLGNPGEKYRSTRHNLGFRVLDELSDALGVVKALECNALVASRKDLMLAWPQTLMNRSGYSVRCLLERHGLVPQQLLVVLDDIALPLGMLRLRSKGGPGGHRGMESVIRNVRTDGVARLRLGIAPADEPADDVGLSEFVLTDFCADEREAVEEMVERGVAACRSWLEDGVEITMNRFNG